MEDERVQRVNLIPAPRREARARRAHLRLLTVVLTAYGVLVAAGYVACYALSDEETEAAFREMHEVAARAKDSDQEIRSLHTTITETQRELAAARAVARHPDWSLLLTLMADSVPDEVVLRRCVLAPVRREDRGDGDPQDDGTDSSEKGSQDSQAILMESLNRSYRLQVGGFAMTQGAVSHFVLRLEKIGLFDQVKLIKTNRQLFLNGQAVAFELECVLRGRRRTASR